MDAPKFVQPDVFAAPAVWNNLSYAIVALTTAPLFKYYQKTHQFNNVSEKCFFFHLYIHDW